MPDDLETGRLASFERSAVISRDAKLPFESDANYEQLAYFLNMAVTQPSIVASTTAFPILLLLILLPTVANDKCRWPKLLRLLRVE